MSIPTTLLKAALNNKIKTGMNAFFVYQGISDYNENRNEGDDVIVSASKAAVSTALGFANPALFAALTVSDIAKPAFEFLNGERQQMRQISVNNLIPFSGSSFMDNKNYATMRQAGMAQAKKSEFTLQQSMMGNEARYLHRE